MTNLIPSKLATLPTPEPGWYPDPSGNAGEQYWDGTRWRSDYVDCSYLNRKIKVLAAVSVAYYLFLVVATYGGLR